MTKIDFLSSQEPDPEARLRLVCRVAQKALRSGESVFIACENELQLQHLDQLLWHFEAESFVPHESLQAESTHTAPVVLGTAESCGDAHGVLINLCSPVPAFFSRFERLFELVVQAPEVLKQTRANWAYYKTRGYPLDLKNI